MDSRELKSALGPITETVIRIDERTKGTDKRVGELHDSMKTLDGNLTSQNTRLTTIENKTQTLEQRPSAIKAVLLLGGIVGVVGAILGTLMAFAK